MYLCVLMALIITLSDSFRRKKKVWLFPRRVPLLCDELSVCFVDILDITEPKFSSLQLQAQDFLTFLEHNLPNGEGQKYSRILCLLPKSLVVGILHEE